ncbi:MAG: biosynthetic-type acetolactate synthase large subunit [Dehalococcoidia bacterium]|nr:MAG: biosynthetic-type acetolactate synthase large subunit [Dehalococcoidia bacterium]
MELTGAQMICESLVREGVEHFFGLPGGATIPFYDILPQYPQLKHILVRHEQVAAHAAEGYARASGKVGVCCATSGPGATNLVTGIANAYLDSVPIVALTGEVVRALIGRDGFQEADITGITLPITKHNYLALDAKDLPRIIREAFHIAGTGRPGPVLIDVPRDVFHQKAEFVYPENLEMRGYRPVPPPDQDHIDRAAELINESKQPLILAGHGVIISQAYEELKELAEKGNIPVITTLLGISSFPGSHPLCLGMPGMHGMYWNNVAMCESDLLIAVGMRFDDRVTGRLPEFAPNAKVVHIDIDPAEIGKNVRPTVAIQSDAKSALKMLNRRVESRPRDDWLAHLDELKREHPSITIRETDKLLPQYVIKTIFDATKGDCTVVTGVGQHQMWSAQFFWFDKPNSLITAGGLGPMGFEVPGAIGVQIARPDELVWSICGDGGFQMTLQDLITVTINDLPIKFAIINNSHLGMVRQWQTLFYHDNLVATPLQNPDFVKIAEAYDILGIRVTDKHMVESAVYRAMEHPGPVIIDFQVQEYENIFPMVPPGAALQETLDLPKYEEERVVAQA